MYEIIKYTGIFGFFIFISYLSYDMLSEYYNEKNKLKKNKPE